MLCLRTADGLDMASFCASFGQEAATAVHNALQVHIRQGLVLQLPRIPLSREGEPVPSFIPEVDIENRDLGDQDWDFRVRLSDPEGFLLSNSVISDVFAAFSFKSAESDSPI